MEQIKVKKPDIDNIKILVIKIGSSVICEANKIVFERIVNIVNQLIKINTYGIHVVVVTSGAIVAGMERLDLKERPGTLPELQAAAATGQSRLMSLYDRAFSKSNIDVAQVLLTREDMDERNRYLNAKNTITKLLELKSIPVVNENDTVAVDEIKFGDNDTLSALVATLIDADWLIILSDIVGVYVPEAKIDAYKKSMEFYDNNKIKNSKVVRYARGIPKDMENICKGVGSSATVGGMMTKIQAAQIVTTCGIPCTVANGNDEDVLIKILNGKDVGTYFLPATKKKRARKRWIGYGSRTKGKIIVDEGAKEALVKRGKSLLSSGIIEVKGDFDQGDAIAISDAQNEVFAKGLSYYSAKELDKIKGKKTSQIPKILGFKYYDEVVHRDNLVLL